MLRIVTDGSVDMPEGWKEKYEINIVPLWVQFGNESYLQGVDINPGNFYRLVREKRIFPKTSLPSPQQVVDFYRKIAEKGDEILSIHLTNTLSGTFSIFQMAARELVNEIKVFPFDSGAGSAALGFMCREARLMAQSGANILEIQNRLSSIRQQLTVMFTLDNLEFAYLSGRVNALQSALSSMLQIKPVIVLRDGLLQMAEKVRTRQKALDRILTKVRQRFGGKKVIMAVVHAADPDMAYVVLEKARRIFNLKEIIITDLSIPVAAHLGPGTIGIIAYSVDE
ncbi:MAG TPA: DegV family protein [Anaerolineaceae bacterium]|nr:DegV family protein [Anaerolineaceae bacterium]